MLSTNELNDLTSEQQELLHLLLEEEAITKQHLPIIPHSNKRDYYPLSFAQRRLWIIDQLHPHSVAYNMCGALHLTGNVNCHVLEQAFNSIIERHELLRARFEVIENEPVLIIEPRLEIPWSFVENTDISQIIKEESKKPFDLTQGPLLRATLIKSTPTEYVLLFTIHHIIADAWSLRIIFQELKAYYQTESENGTSDLPTLNIQYTDYSIWQQNATISPDFSENTQYWKNKLVGAESILNLPTDAIRPAIPSNAGDRFILMLPPFLAAQLKALSLEQDVSVFMLFLTVFQTLLFRLTNQEDILIGTVSSNRTRAELEHLIGLFSNTLVLRSDLSGNPSFDELLRKTKKVVLDAFAHQELPFEKVVEELNIARDLSRHPLFQVMFVYDEKSSVLQMNDIAVKQLSLDSVDSKFDLTLFVEESENTFKICFEYNTDLFERATIESYGESYTALLESIVQTPNQNLSKLKTLNHSLEKKLLTWSDSSGSAKNYCLHQLFERWAETTPTGIAIRYQDAEISYQTLNEHSNQIAHGLMKAGIKKNQPIAMILETGIDQITALLAICKTGGIFVCLDQNYPALRLNQILAEVKPACFILDTTILNTHGALLSDFQQENDYKMPIFTLAELIDERETRTLQNPDIDVSPSDPVYIVYTSGSTGKPKGILQAHGCSSQYMEWQSDLFEIHPGKHMGQWASITYDASYSEIFGALCFGATLCISQASDRRDPRAIAEWLVTENINVIQLVPSFCKLVLQNFIKMHPIADHTFTHLQYVLLAGERLPVELARSFLQYFKNVTKLYNLYGPSEIVLTSQYLVDKLPEHLSNIPIGQPFTGRQILILDKHHQLCPLRVPGEIYIKSPYLTLGYYKQPEETEKTFIQNPLHNDYPDRVYKTGDRGRWLHTGEIEFLGRNDNQLKIRGSRVEIGEIEAVLSKHPNIEECAIITKYHSDDSPYLVAFIAGSEESTTSLLRGFLANYLPVYMIPDYFVWLPSLPHTISGKADRKLLGTYTKIEQDLPDEVSLPATQLEQQIAAIWKDYLNVSSVNLHSNFFDIGGHSLLMIQVQMKLNEALDKNIPLIDMFKFPTIKSLANYLANDDVPTDFMQLGKQRALLRQRLTKKK